MNAHVENPNWPGFTGILPKDRIAAAGNNQYSTAGEVMSFNTNASCVDDTLNSVFHRSGILQTSTQFVGFGLFSSQNNEGGIDPMTGKRVIYTVNSCTIEYGYKGNPNTAPSNWVGVYPGIDQTNVPVGMPIGESPDPAPSIPNASKGYPVSIYFRSSLWLVNSFTMTASGSNTPMPVTLIIKKDFPGYMGNNEAHIMATQNLAKGTTYNVAFSGKLQNGEVVSKNWSFKTTAN
jgi:hypothetical protein